MNRVAIIKNGIIANIALIKDAANCPANMVAIPDGIKAGIGWGYDGNSFSAPAGSIPDLAALKSGKKAVINAAFENAAATGQFTLPNPLNFDVDCRRAGVKNDLENCRNLLDLLKNAGSQDDDSINGSEGYKGADNQWHPCTVAQLRDVVIPAMQQYGLGLYKKKWGLEAQIDAASNQDDLDAIAW